MKRIGEILEEDTVVVLNAALKRGFTQLPNYVLKDTSLSMGARLSYAILLSYAWQEKSCFPGQKRMADELGVSVRTVREYLRELKSTGYIDWLQRGLNKTNVYYILDFQPLALDRKRASAQERVPLSVQGRKHGSD
jgi:DNA-binding transcriptional MocR family regulator